ncbi:MAG TPA: HAMP domain-containing sensor histidine kinase [Candidatus Acidoferrales bacterium]|nr:HAMP domain-containing sensor histidine kinase [Candidatus Acidoferrales bacterium]
MVVLAGSGEVCSEAALALEPCARRVTRSGDECAFDAVRGRFAIAMLAPSRDARAPDEVDVRTAMERLVAAVSLATGVEMRAGWCAIREHRQLAAFPQTLDAALERGARLRERYAMLATVGHELRTPLTSIRGYIETLLDEELDRATARRFLETARREALRLGRIVEGMLEFSLLDLTVRHDRGNCDVAEQIRATVEAALPLARERRVAIAARLPAHARARIDGDACVHALLNLVENGVKYGREGGSVEIACLRDEAYVTIFVDDDGPGIDCRDRDAIFALGIRANRGGAPGSGIGLAVVRAIAQRAGGDVRAERSPLGGARFVLRLPAGT